MPDKIYRPTESDAVKPVSNPDVSGGPHPADPGIQEELIKNIETYDPEKLILYPIS